MHWWIWVILVIIIIPVLIFGYNIVAIFIDIMTAPEITLENYKDKIYPRLLSKKSLDEQLEKRQIPFMPLSNTELYVVYVAKTQKAFLTITQKDLERLGMDKEAINELALNNLEKTFPKDLVEKCLKENSMTAMKLLDSFDASRILILPKYLPEGSKMVALIPDRNTLAITPFVEENDCLQKLKNHKIPVDGIPLTDKPLLVSRKGIEILYW